MYKYLKVCQYFICEGDSMNSLHFIVGGAVALLIVLVAIFGFQSNSEYNKSDFLRIHIRANSNSEVDQRVKYEVKSEVVDFLTPLLAEATTKELAIKIINDNIDGIEATADSVLKRNGFTYTAYAEIRQENFPTRQYDELVLESGIYDALILNLGTGEGDNWWCVVYPPLCFVGGQDDGSNEIEYRSKIVEIINKFFG